MNTNDLPNLSRESLIEWAAHWVPEANRVRFAEALTKELDGLYAMGFNAARNAARKVVSDQTDGDSQFDGAIATMLIELANLRPDWSHTTGEVKP